MARHPLGAGSARVQHPGGAYVGQAPLSGRNVSMDRRADEGMDEAQITDIPTVNGEDFEIYGGGIFPAKTMDLVWAKKQSPADAMAALTKKWQEDLAAG